MQWIFLQMLETTQLDKTFAVLCGTRRCINVVRRTRH